MIDFIETKDIFKNNSEIEETRLVKIHNLMPMSIYWQQKDKNELFYKGNILVFIDMIESKIYLPSGEELSNGSIYEEIIKILENNRNNFSSSINTNETKSAEKIIKDTLKK